MISINIPADTHRLMTSICVRSVKIVVVPFILYYNMNNLYGRCPYRLIFAICRISMGQSELWRYRDRSEFAHGYILEVDFEYPQHLYDRHTDLFFCRTRACRPAQSDFRFRYRVCTSCSLDRIRLSMNLSFQSLQTTHVVITYDVINVECYRSSYDVTLYLSPV